MFKWSEKLKLFPGSVILFASLWWYYRFWLTCINKVSLCNDPMASVSFVCVTNFNIGNISDTFYSRVMKVGPKVACGETFKMLWIWVTLTSVQSHSIYRKFGKCLFLTISQTLFTVELWDVAKRWPRRRPSQSSRKASLFSFLQIDFDTKQIKN